MEGANLATIPAGREAALHAGIRIVPGVIANIGGAGAAALAVTRVVPFELPAAARKQWVFDWVADKVTHNTRDLFDLTDTEPLTALDTLLAHRRAERDQLPAFATVSRAGECAAVSAVRDVPTAVTDHPGDELSEAKVAFTARNGLIDTPLLGCRKADGQAIIGLVCREQDRR